MRAVATACVSVCVRACIHAGVRASARACVCECAYIYIYLSLSVYVRLCVRAHARVCNQVYMTMYYLLLFRRIGAEMGKRHAKREDRRCGWEDETKTRNTERNKLCTLQSQTHPPQSHKDRIIHFAPVSIDYVPLRHFPLPFFLFFTFSSSICSRGHVKKKKNPNNSSIS